METCATALWLLAKSMWMFSGTVEVLVPQQRLDGTSALVQCSSLFDFSGCHADHLLPCHLRARSEHRCHVLCMLFCACPHYAFCAMPLRCMRSRSTSAAAGSPRLTARAAAAMASALAWSSGGGQAPGRPDGPSCGPTLEPAAHNSTTQSAVALRNSRQFQSDEHNFCAGSAIWGLFVMCRIARFGGVVGPIGLHRSAMAAQC